MNFYNNLSIFFKWHLLIFTKWHSKGSSSRCKGYNFLKHLTLLVTTQLNLKNMSKNRCYQMGIWMSIPIKFHSSWNPHFQKKGFKMGIKTRIANNKYFEEFGILVWVVKWGYRILLFRNANYDCVDPNIGLDFF